MSVTLPLLLVKGIISDLPAEDQKKIHDSADKFRSVLADSGDHGCIALALVVAEEECKQEIKS